MTPDAVMSYAAVAQPEQPLGSRKRRRLSSAHLRTVSSVIYKVTSREIDQLFKSIARLDAGQPQRVLFSVACRSVLWRGRRCVCERSRCAAAATAIQVRHRGVGGIGGSSFWCADRASD